MKFRDKIIFDKTFIFINRQIARYLNFFEKNCTTTKILLKIQAEKFMTRYVINWTNFILFLIRFFEHTNNCFFLTICYLKQLFEIFNCVNEIKCIVIALLTINIQKMTLQKCFEFIHLNLFLNDDEIDNETFVDVAINLQMHAKIFVQIVITLFQILIRFRWKKFVFTCSIIEFVILHTFNENDSWISIRNFSSRLNDWIHCMQFWLLNYFFTKLNRKFIEKFKLQKFVRKQRIKYLINIAFNFISKFNY